MKNKKLMAAAAVATALSVTLPTAAAPLTAAKLPAAAESSLSEAESPANEAAGKAYGNVWSTNTHIAIEDEQQMMQDAQLTLDRWDRQIADAKAEGFGTPLDKAALEKAGSEILEQDGNIYYIGSSSALGTVKNAADAYRLAFSLLPMFGGTEQTDLRLLSKVTMNDETVYAFQQIADSQALSGSSMKIAVNKDGSVSAVFNGIEKADQEEVGETKNATREQVEQAVRDEMKDTPSAEILSDRTERILHYPVTMDMLKIDDGEEEGAEDVSEEEEEIPAQVLWVVYTKSEDPEYPYTAHYVKLDGTYVSSLAVKEPGDEESRSGFRKQPLFDGMTPDTWTGEITDVNDEKTEVTLPVMYNAEKKCWYLGDLNRRIAVVDYREAAYGENHELNLVSSDKNEWDNEDLFMLYNYIKAWDYYADMGWIGPNGRGTDVVILKGLCTEDGVPFENACSIGSVEGWQMFGYTAYDASGKPLRLTHGLDVMAHEYTHTFTGTMLLENMYKNDYGAINESFSDIMGNIIEFTLGATDDTRWRIGENTGMTIRSMADPHDYDQPEFVWDMFYGPNTEDPKAVNDEGGVHGNSSLLSRIAARLCLDSGMSLSEASDFWITAETGLTTRTDFVRIPALLNWALEVSGNETYKEDLNKLIEHARLDVTSLPDKLPANERIVKLRLPDTEAFADRDWALVAFQPDTERVSLVLSAVLSMGKEILANPDEITNLIPVLQELTSKLHLDGTRLKLDELDTSDEDAVLSTLTEAFLESLTNLVSQNMSWEGAEQREIDMVTRKAPTFYMLLSASDEGTEFKGMAILIGKHWYDLGSLAALGGELQENADENGEVDYTEALEEAAQMAEQILKDIFSSDTEEADGNAASESETKKGGLVEELLNMAGQMLEAEGTGSEDTEVMLPAETVELPTAGLEKVKLVDLKPLPAGTDSGAESIAEENAAESVAEDAA